MKKLISALTVLSLILMLAVPASAGTVTYSENAGKFIFEPGTEYSLTDLFTNFKGVMPGDHLTQLVTVRNRADNQVKVKIYIRSRGAHEGSEDFLSMLDLKVRVLENGAMDYMFDAAADETAQLTEWTYLGTLYSGGEVDLEVILDVPKELGNEYQDAIGLLDWEFLIEEYPVDPDDPTPPPTGDMGVSRPASLMAVSTVAIFFLLFLLWKKRKEETA